MRMGRSLKDKAPPTDHETLHETLVQLKTNWTSLCSKAVDRFLSLSVCLSVSVYVFVSVSACLSACFCVFASVCLSVCLSHLSQVLFLSSSVSVPFCLSLMSVCRHSFHLLACLRFNFAVGAS